MTNPASPPERCADDIRAVYQATVAVITNLGTIRFAQGALYVAAQVVLLTVLAQPKAHAVLFSLQPFIPAAGLWLYAAIIVLEVRNSVIADKAHTTARSLEAAMKCGNEPTPFVNLENANPRSRITHWLGLHMTYGLFAVTWAILFVAAKAG